MANRTIPYNTSVDTWTQVGTGITGLDIRQLSANNDAKQYLRLVDPADDAPTTAIDDDTDHLLFGSAQVEIWSLDSEFKAYVRCRVAAGRVKVTI